MLRHVKECVDSLPVYIGCLSSFVALEVQQGLLDPSLLAQYKYYAIMALKSPQPRIRVSGLAILVTAVQSSQANAESVLAMISSSESSFLPLVRDSWWEVQAQLLLLTSALLNRIAEANEEWKPSEEIVEELLNTVQQIFNAPGTSKIILQVGLCGLAPCLTTWSSLIPAYVRVLLGQKEPLRRRLLAPQPTEDGQPLPPRRQ